MVYKIYNIETNMYIGTTNNNNRDASKECCFEKEAFFLVALMAIGVPEATPKGPAKKNLEEIYTFFG